MIVDAHQHFWNMDKVEYSWLIPEYGVLYRNYQPMELEPLLADSGVNQTVLVQAADSHEDTKSMLQIAAEYSWVAGVVGWVPLSQPEKTAEALETYKKNPVFKGVRHLIHDEKDKDWVVRDNVIEGLKILAEHEMTFDVIAVYPNHLHHILTLSDKIPSLKMVIDHLAKPPLAKKEMEEWSVILKDVAGSPNVYAKVSGLNTRGDNTDWSSETIQPVFDIAMNCFGANRLMYGSDWPVVNLAGGYRKYWQEMQKIIDKLTKTESESILFRTASTFYGLFNGGAELDYKR